MEIPVEKSSRNSKIAQDPVSLGNTNRRRRRQSFRDFIKTKKVQHHMTQHHTQC